MFKCHLASTRRRTILDRSRHCFIRFLPTSICSNTTRHARLTFKFCNFCIHTSLSSYLNANLLTTMRPKLNITAHPLTRLQSLVQRFPHFSPTTAATRFIRRRYFCTSVSRKISCSSPGYSSQVYLKINLTSIVLAVNTVALR